MSIPGGGQGSQGPNQYTQPRNLEIMPHRATQLAYELMDVGVGYKYGGAYEEFVDVYGNVQFASVNSTAQDQGGTSITSLPILSQERENGDVYSLTLVAAVRHERINSIEHTGTHVNNLFLIERLRRKNARPVLLASPAVLYSEDDYITHLGKAVPVRIHHTDGSELAAKFMQGIGGVDGLELYLKAVRAGIDVSAEKERLETALRDRRLTSVRFSHFHTARRRQADQRLRQLAGPAMERPIEQGTLSLKGLGLWAKGRRD